MCKPHTGAMQTNSSPVTVPPSYVAKYNRFVDNVLGRINKILRKNYDPVNVRLQTPTESTTDNKKKGTTQKPKTKNKVESREGAGQVLAKNDTSSPAPTVDPALTETEASANQTAVNGTARAQRKHGHRNHGHHHHHHHHNKRQHPSQKQRQSHPPHHPHQQHPQQHNRKSRAQNNKPNAGNKNKNAKPTPPRARATMYGLSTLRRDGDVSVNVMNSHTTVKTKFLVGPLTLKVEKEFGRGAKKEIRSATATTGELVGRLNMRVLNGGAATLHSIRVHQPKQVESADDHDKTREYVWRRSNMIAHLVSQKLTFATKSMLQPTPEKSDLKV